MPLKNKMIKEKQTDREKIKGEYPFLTREEELGKGCGKEIEDKIYCGHKDMLGQVVWLCPECKLELKGIQEGKRIERERFGEIVLDILKICENIILKYSWKEKEDLDKIKELKQNLTNHSPQNKIPLGERHPIDVGRFDSVASYSKDSLRGCGKEFISHAGIKMPCGEIGGGEFLYCDECLKKGKETK